MNNKPYIVSKVKFNDEIRYVLFEITPSIYRSLVEWCNSFEELMIKIDLKGYDRNEIQFSDDLKDYEDKEN